MQNQGKQLINTWCFFLPLALSERKSFPVLHGQYKYSSLLTWSLTEAIFYRPII